MYNNIVQLIREIYNTQDFIPLHEPKFIGNEKKYLNDCIDSTFVSSVGEYVDRFEDLIARYTGAKYAVATVNGTTALHISLLLSGVRANDEVLTQPLTFVATCNAINYANAHSVFIDVDKDTLGMSPDALRNFLNKNASIEDGICMNNITKRVIRSCVPMHTFGHPCKIDEIKEICDTYNIVLVEDAAESLGSFYKNQHTGTFGRFGAISFNGNKVITSGGGGCILTNNENLAKEAKHITTTAKVPHKWDYVHDLVGYNYRLPNLNAALLCAQLENLDKILDNKREIAMLYNDFFKSLEIDFVAEPKNSKSNYWLNSIILKDRKERDNFLEKTNNLGIMTRPIWKLMNRLEMYKENLTMNIDNCVWLEDRVVNIPSSFRTL